MKIVDRNGTWDHPPWFFSMSRYNPGGPTWYGDENRLPPQMYLTRSIMGIISAALTFLFVLFVILPIIKHRLQSVIVAVNSIAIGVTVSLCLVCPEWIRGHSTIQSQIDYHSPETYEMALGVHIGLAGFNVTLRTIDRNFDVQMDGKLKRIGVNETEAPVIFFNEHVKLYHPDFLEDVMPDALRKGLPIPLLAAYECLTSATLGFDWSQRLVEAGYHCYLITVFTLTGWFLNQILIASIPRYSAYGFVVIGYMMIFNNVVYFFWSRISTACPCIVISDSYVELRYGVCFWSCLVMGVWSLVYGSIMTTYDTIHPDKFLTVFDLDYDHKRALATAHRLNHLPKMNSSLRRERLPIEEDPFVQTAA